MLNYPALQNFLLISSFPFLAAYSAEDVPVTPSNALRLPKLEPIHGSSPSDLAAATSHSELGGTTPFRVGNGVSATRDGLARTPSAPITYNSNVKNCHATQATPKKVVILLLKFLLFTLIITITTY